MSGYIVAGYCVALGGLAAYAWSIVARERLARRRGAAPERDRLEP